MKLRNQGCQLILGHYSAAKIGLMFTLKRYFFLFCGRVYLFKWNVISPYTYSDR